MQRSRRVGIATFVLSSKAHLAAIRPREDVLVLETLFFADEVRPVSEIDYPISLAEPNERELDVAMKLVDLLAAEWAPERYRDAYREQVLGLIESKAAGAGVVREEESAGLIPGVADLMAALQASVEAARKGPAGPRTRRRRTG
jgi:DNA end-binding protein Ku